MDFRPHSVGIEYSTCLKSFIFQKYNVSAFKCRVERFFPTITKKKHHLEEKMWKKNTLMNILTCASLFRKSKNPRPPPHTTDARFENGIPPICKVHTVGYMYLILFGCKRFLSNYITQSTSQGWGLSLVSRFFTTFLLKTVISGGGAKANRTVDF